MPKVSRQILGRSRLVQRWFTKKLRLMDQAASEISSLPGTAAQAAAPATPPMN